MTSSNYARQVFRGNVAIVQKQATQFELYGLLLLVKEENLSFGRTRFCHYKQLISNVAKVAPPISFLDLGK